MAKPLDFDFLNAPAYEVAPQLLGLILCRRIGNKQLLARIVETEAYTQSDAASHSYKGFTKRNSIMFGPSGYLYVYFTYGMHYCCNIVVGHPGDGSAVLIRAVEPLSGIDEMETNRSSHSGVNLTNGPAKLCQALKIDIGLNGHNLRNSPFRLTPGNLVSNEEIFQTTRIGINSSKNTLWRFYINNNPYVSKK